MRIKQEHNMLDFISLGIFEPFVPNAGLTEDDINYLIKPYITWYTLFLIPQAVVTFFMVLYAENVGKEKPKKKRKKR